MSRPPHDFDWHELCGRPHDERPTSSTRNRQRWILGFYAAALAIVLLRAVQLELSDGARYRRLAAQPRENAVTLEAPRGRILARDGTVLAADTKALSLAVDFRYLENPPQLHWLRHKARARLTRAQRRDPRRLAAAEDAVRRELADLHRRLAALCNVSDAEWRDRAARINRRVTRLAENVNRRRLQLHQQQTAEQPDDDAVGPLAILAGLFAPPRQLPPAEVIVVEQTAYHRIVDNLSTEAAEWIAAGADAFPGVRVVASSRRAYPLGSLAANIVGHVGFHDGAIPTAVVVADDPASDTPIGLLGAERALESKLAGQPGRARRFTDRRGRPLSIEIQQPPVAGRDVVLSLDPKLQRFAEQLLDRSARRTQRGSQHGGAIVVIDVRSGEVLAAASEPRFDPNWFATGDRRVEAVLADARQPLFDRATKMAIPPGSVFKPLTALALLARGIVAADQPFHCQGYLDQPDSMRCRIFLRQGIGHADVTLADALAKSCNVYFFHHAQKLGAAPLLDWAARFGFGQPTGSDWPDQAVGELPDLTEPPDLGQLPNFSIGQGALTATPLQVVRLYAAIANGGYLVEARFTRDSIAPQKVPNEASPPVELSGLTRVAGLEAQALAAVREGLRRTVEDPAGTAFTTVRLPGLSVAGKTGTAETGGGQADHAWFAGYAPADAPRLAFVVALEHGGSGATAAGPIARNLIEHLRQLGYFPAPITAKKKFPPGKG